jgi:hypothetical protein
VQGPVPVRGQVPVLEPVQVPEQGQVPERGQVRGQEPVLVRVQVQWVLLAQRLACLPGVLWC